MYNTKIHIIQVFCHAYPFSIAVHRAADPAFFARFCDDNPSNKPINTRKHCDHYALIKKSVSIYRHKTETRNPKKKSTG